MSKNTYFGSLRMKFKLVLAKQLFSTKNSPFYQIKRFVFDKTGRFTYSFSDRKSYFYHGSGLKFKFLLWSEYSNVTSRLYRFLWSLTRVSMIQSEKYFKYSDSVSVSRGNPFEPFYNLFFSSKYCFLYSS